MNISEAKKAGVKAFNEGFRPAPILNQEFMSAACASPVATLDLLTAYSYGWTIANLAEGAVDMGHQDMPSVQSLREIMAA